MSAQAPLAPAAGVHVENVVKRFGDVVAVDGVSLSVNPGEFFALLGPSGCGKTTLLRVIAGLETSAAGRVLVGGTDVTDLPAHRRPVNMVFQQYALFPHLNVHHNVAFGLRYRGIRGADARRRVAEALDLVQLHGLAARMPDQLSGGQRQRVALARALVLRPQVLLLDEPLAALDQKLRREMQLELKRLQRTLSITFIFVTHDQEEALTMSDRIAVMNRGRVEQIGATEEVFERPATAFVAEFMGAGNLMESREGGRTVRFIVRPEKLALRTTPPEASCAMACVEVTVEERSYQGVSTVWTVRTIADERLSIYQQNDRSAREAPVLGDRAYACWDPRNAVVLEGDVR